MAKEYKIDAGKRMFTGIMKSLARTEASQIEAVDQTEPADPLPKGLGDDAKTLTLKTRPPHRSSDLRPRTRRGPFRGGT